MKTRLLLTCALAFTTVIFADNFNPNSFNSAKAAPTPDASTTTASSPSTVYIPAPPDVKARAYVIMDSNSGKIIAEKNADKRYEPASLTKMMTAYIISNAIKHQQISLDDKVHISADAWKQGGSRMFVKENSNVPVRDLIQGIIVQSGNDACYAMAQFIGGNETTFAQIMNQTAQQLGMKNTHFVTSTGLPNTEHYSTAHDLAILARHLVNDFPEDYKWYKEKWFTYNGIKQPNRNRLLWRDTSVDGIKTGHTKEAGYCLATSAKRGDMRVVTIAMGTPSDEARNDVSETLLNYAFRFYESRKLYAANSPIIEPRVWLAASKHADLGVIQDLYVTIPTGSYQNLKAAVALNEPLKAPIKKGDTYGQLNVTLNGKVISTTNLVALDNDPQGGVFSRMGDHVAMFFSGWFSSKA